MKASHPGIDYGLGRTNIDHATGYSYGVISCNSIMPEALDDVDPDYGTPQDAFECPECGHEEHADNWGDTITCSECGEEFDADMPDFIESNGWSYNKDGYAIADCLDNDAIVTKSPYYTYAQFCSPCVPGAGNLDSPFDFQPVNVAAPNQQKRGLIINSTPETSFARDAEAAGFPRVYCLGHDWFEGGKAPYPVISVETNQHVAAP